ncbi:MAG TPA: SDR family oxidoreductase [Pseudorhizobium sp.]|nr:SDR family oxidoreductase [Pseudorhizobium sp.]
MMQTWLITGTSSGFGRILTERLLDRGDRVAATLRRTNALDDLKERYGDRLWIASLDLTDTTAIRTTVDRAFAELGRIDVAVSNAGYGLFGAGEEVTDEQIEHQIATNLTGSIQFIRKVLPHLRNQRGGRILQVSSEGGQMAYPNFSLYHATKWGIEGFAEAVRQEVEPFGISMTIIEPGPTNTDFASGLVRAPVMDVYDETPAGAVRKALDGGTFAVTGNPYKMVDAILQSAAKTPAPIRLALGKTTYASVKAALTARLAELEAQKDIALAMDDDA